MDKVKIVAVNPDLSILRGAPVGKFFSNATQARTALIVFISIIVLIKPQPRSQASRSDCYGLLGRIRLESDLAFVLTYGMLELKL